MDDHEESKKKVRNTQHATMQALPTCNLEKLIVSNPKGLEGEQTLENSIFLTMRNSDNDRDRMFLCCFLEWSINIFNVHKWAFEANITNSSSPAMLVKTELKKLNQFFEAGEYQAGKAPHSKLVTEDVYDVHTSRLYGGRVKLISPEKWKDLAEIMDSELIKEPTNQVTIDHWSELDAVMGSKHLNEPLEYFKENIDYVVTLEWYLSIDLQVLLWIRDYLEELDKSQDFKEIFSRRERVSPLEFLPSETRKQGFQMSKPQAIPALYQALTDNNLIDKISFPDFNDAFTSEKGCITWARNKDQLGYLIKGLQSKSVIISNNHMEAATRVFKVTQGKELNAGGLSSSADQLSEKKRPLMDGIIQQVIDS